MRKSKKSTSSLKGCGEVWYKKGTVQTTMSHFRTPFFDSNYGDLRYLGLQCQQPVYGKVWLQSIFQDKVSVLVHPVCRTVTLYEQGGYLTFVSRASRPYFENFNAYPHASVLAPLSRWFGCILREKINDWFFSVQTTLRYTHTSLTSLLGKSWWLVALGIGPTYFQVAHVLIRGEWLEKLWMELNDNRTWHTSATTFQVECIEPGYVSPDRLRTENKLFIWNWGS